MAIARERREHPEVFGADLVRSAVQCARMSNARGRMWLRMRFDEEQYQHVHPRAYL